MNSLRRWWRRFRSRGPKITRVRYYAARGDLPETIPTGTLAVIGGQEKPKWLILECPCGRGHQLTVSLSREHRPYWRLTAGRGGPSLYPSIDFDADFRCHFWLRDGRVHWIRGWWPSRCGAHRRVSA